MCGYVVPFTIADAGVAIFTLVCKVLEAVLDIVYMVWAANTRGQLCLPACCGLDPVRHGVKAL